jgi:hypothetical protein
MTTIDWPASDQALWYVAVEMVVRPLEPDWVQNDACDFFWLWHISILEGR